jgi:hypothetical protein
MKNTTGRECGTCGENERCNRGFGGRPDGKNARHRQKDKVQVISKETEWEETNTDMSQGRTSGGLSHHRGTQCGQFLD